MRMSDWSSDVCSSDLDRVFQLDELAGDAGEHVGHVEGLRQEALDLAGAADGELVLFGQLVHAEDRDDVLKRLVLLQDRLHRTSHLIIDRKSTRLNSSH